MGIAIGYIYGNFHPAFVYSLGMAIGLNQRVGAQDLLGLGCLYPDNGRNKLAEMFLQTNCEWLWSVDTDVGGFENHLEPMLEASRGGARKIIAAPYWVQHPDLGNYTTWMRHEQDGLQPYFTIPKSGTIKLGACGMGCTLIHRKVFEDVAALPRDPRDPWIWYGREILDIGHTAGRAGEDVSFCLRAASVGHDTWGVCEIPVNHYKSHAVAEPTPGSAIVSSRHTRPSGLVVPV